MEQLHLPVIKNRNLYLSAQVTQESMLALTKSILEINESDEYNKKYYTVLDMEYVPKPIKIYIDSYGGNVYQCLGLLSVMDNSKTPVHTIVTGCAMSCGFMILINGHKRFGYKHSTTLYHQVSSWAVGNLKTMEEDVEETKRLQKIIEELTLKKTKISVKKLEKVYKTKKDWFIPAKESLELSIIDEIIG